MAINPDANKELIAEDYSVKVGKLYSAGAAPKVLKPEKAKASDQQKEPHVTNQLIVKGNLFKGKRALARGQKIEGDYYPWNAWNFVGAKGKPNRDAYNGSAKGMNPLPDGYAFYKADNAPNFNPEYKRKDLNTDEIQKALIGAHAAVHSATDSDRDAAEATLKWRERLLEQSKKPDNIGQSLPYKWEAHHILPMSAFFRYLTAPQIQIVLASDYDINSGENMIMLPGQSEAMAIHGLPGHWSDHRQYTAKLEDEFKQRIVKPIEEAAAEKQPHDDVVVNVEAELHDLEDDQFDLLVDLGPSRLL